MRRVGGEGEGNLVSKHEILAAPTTGLARNVRHTGAAKKHVSVIQHLPSLVTRSRRPEDSRKGGGRKGWAKWIMYNTDRTKAFKLHAVIMCKFVCIVVTPSTKKTKQGKKKNCHKERTTAFDANRGIKRNAGLFY